MFFLAFPTILNLGAHWESWALTVFSALYVNYLIESSQQPCELVDNRPFGTVLIPMLRDEDTEAQRGQGVQLSAWQSWNVNPGAWVPKPGSHHYAAPTAQCTYRYTAVEYIKSNAIYIYKDLCGVWDYYDWGFEPKSATLFSLWVSVPSSLKQKDSIVTVLERMGWDMCTAPAVALT